MKKEVAIHYGKTEITIHSEDDMVNITELWKGSGANKDKTPNDWLNIDSSKQLVETVANMLNTVPSGIIKAKRGKGGGTSVHKHIALAYAKYLDPKLHIAVNQVFFERIEEERNPDLIIDRAVSTYKKKGKSEEWIERRIKGKLKRKEFTRTLATHAVNNEGFRNCTNEIYRPFFGGTSSVVRQKKGIPAKASIRDNLSTFELDAVNFSESTASEMINGQNLNGNAECEIACNVAATLIGKAIAQAKRTDVKSLNQ